MSNILRRLSTAVQQNNSNITNVAEHEETSSYINDNNSNNYSGYNTNYEAKQNDFAKPASKPESVLTSDVKFEGEIEFKDSLVVYGSISGSITSKGELSLEKGSTINANVKAKNIMVNGNFKGKIEAEGRVELQNNAKICGSIDASSIVVQEGVVFVGEAKISSRNF